MTTTRVMRIPGPDGERISGTFKGSGAVRKADAWVVARVAEGFIIEQRDGGGGIGAYKNVNVRMFRPSALRGPQPVTQERTPFEQWAIDRIEAQEARIRDLEAVVSSLHRRHSVDA